MSDVVRYEPTAWVSTLPAIGDLAVKIADTAFVPDHFKHKPAEVAAAILTGQEVGLGPMAALNGISVIKGKPTLSAATMRALILSHGHELWTDEITDHRVILCGRRRGTENVVRVAWSMDDAKRAGLTGNDTYRKYPRQMLLARATGELARLLFADVLGGIAYTPEDMEGSSGPDSPPPSGHTTGTRRTAQRASAARAEAPTDVPPAPTPPPAQERDEPGPEHSGEAVSGPGLPPVEAVVEDVVDGEIVEEEPPPPPPAKPRATGITPAQSRMLHATFNTCGVKTRDDRMRISSAIVGRHLESSSDLTKDEAGGLIDALSQVAETDDPLVRLEALISVTAVQDELT